MDKAMTTLECAVENAPREAICILAEDGNSGASGVVRFTQKSPNEKCEVSGEFKGMKPGLHGFHVHQFGNLLDGCKTAGPHYNPHGVQHGGPDDEIRHNGDLGNVEAVADGTGKYYRMDQLVTLYGQHSVLGRTCVLHADEDDLGKGGHELSLTTGNAGARIACGVIGTL